MQHINGNPIGNIIFNKLKYGKGSFEIENKTEECQKGDLVVIPNNTAFKYTDKLKMLLVTIPWWYPEQEETL